MTLKACLFDLDGTLLDTNQMIVESFQYTLKTILNLEPPVAEIQATFGRPLQEVMYEYSPHQADLLLHTYRHHNAQIHDQKIAIFPHVAETLEKLYQNNIPLAIVTSKKIDMAQRGLGIFSLQKYFQAIVGPEHTRTHKPAPEPVLYALRQLDVAPEEAIMIGDSAYDILSGQRAGTKTAGLTYSVHGPDYLAQYRPDYMFNTIADLEALLHL